MIVFTEQINIANTELLITLKFVIYYTVLDLRNTWVQLSHSLVCKHLLITEDVVYLLYYLYELQE